MGTCPACWVLLRHMYALRLQTPVFRRPAFLFSPGTCCTAAMAAALSAGCWRLPLDRAARCPASPATGRRGYRSLGVLASSSDPAPGSQPAAQVQEPAAAPSLSSAPTAQQSSSSTNGLLAGGAIALGVGLFLAGRLVTSGPSFAALEAESVPIDTALSNGLPTVIEFFADYCEVR